MAVNRSRWPVLSMLVLIQACATRAARDDLVFVDGRFEEWEGATLIIEDGADAASSGVDIGSIYGLDDPGWLYLAIELGREVNIQSLPGTLHLLMDADGDPVTGGTQHTMDGVDVVLELSQTADPLVEGRGSGFALRTIEEDGSRGTSTRYALGVTAGPSWAARRHELRISRRGADLLPVLGPELRLKVVYVVGGRIEDETPIGWYGFRTSVAPAPVASGARLAKPDGSIRVAQWNVSSGSFLDDPAGFARILAAVEPDVILLDEVAGAITAEAVESFFSLAPLSELGTWRFVLGESGGRQRTIVGARDREIRPAESMRRVTYPDGALDELRRSTPPAFHRLLELEARRQVSATGAWVDVGGRDVLFVAVDLQSAGWAHSPQDLLRTLQAATVRDHVLAERRGSRSPVVVGGDLNLVGSDIPLLTLIRGLDVDGSDLMRVDAPRIGERTYSTWRDSDGFFAPGRLDFLLVPDAAVTVVNSFVFTTEDLDVATLQRLALEPGLSATLSDHLVVTADLRFDGVRGR